jgi:hypothetical protein
MIYFDSCFDCGEVTEHDLNTESCQQCSPPKKKGHLFNFIIFKNYDGTTTGKSVPRETYDRIMTGS